MIPWSVLTEPLEGREEEAGGEAPEGVVQVALGSWRGVPVWVECRQGPGGRLVVERLVTTDPELYLWPALGPGAVLPPA
ncbi:hypothetical protein [Geochorda subterranea]|uniref:YlzJ-like protein n=1 Tax=Geochorda subterranea TaxID=3109564 RepID=A0ABZ1BLT6_9FIRM|nr:hypothetical protein [Limnochorda sp. LNt]WRP13426.1 hypothetical protein VLY81_08165 [Limnochorda sp. LNt]